ncbi:MAG: glycosyltransferase [Methylophilaceae bacterium]
MKILMLGTLTNSMNGSARSFVRLCNFLATRHEVYAAVPDLDGIALMLSDQVKEVVVEDISPIRRSLRAVLYLPLSIYKLIHLIRRLKPDVIHINDIPWFYAVAVARFMGIPVVLHSRYYEKNDYVKKVISLFIGKADATIYVSDFNKKMWGVSGNSQYRLHNPGIFNLKLDLSCDLPPKYALVVSRVSQEKGIYEAIQFFSILALQDEALALVIAGDALYNYQKEYLKQCQGLISALGIESRVLWLGHVVVPHALYMNAELYIHLPNFEDPFPTTMMEALAIGCRILTNGRGGIAEQVEGFDGVLTLKTDDTFDRQADALEKFMSSSLPKYDRAQLYKERFDEVRFYVEFESILIAATQGAEGRPSS